MTVAWITGGGTGIGRALAERLYQQGARVLISGRRKEIIENAASEIGASGGPGEIMAVAGDACDASHVMESVSRVKKRWGEITLLINNAGANPNKAFSETSFEEYQKSFEINCLTAVRATQATLPAMLKTGQGAIVNVSSIYGKWASGRSISYSVGKYAMAGFTDALRQVLIGTQVHVLGVYPGFIKTSMTLPFVQPGSLRSYLGKTPDHMALAILKALRCKKTELYYPWYIPWVLRLHRWMPVWSDVLAERVKR